MELPEGRLHREKVLKPDYLNITSIRIWKLFKKDNVAFQYQNNSNNNLQWNNHSSTAVLLLKLLF